MSDITFRPIIQSLLDTDLYKFTMMQEILHHQPQTSSEYTFKCRNTPKYPLSDCIVDIQEQINHLCTLKFTEEELCYIGNLRFIKSDFVDFLRLFQLQSRFITVSPKACEPQQINITVKGPMLHCMLYEIYILAIINEIYFRKFSKNDALETGRANLQAKIKSIHSFSNEIKGQNPFIFFDFGTRRRFSRDWHEEVVSTLAKEVSKYMHGTSNVLLAKRYNLVPIGTMAHEYLQAYQSFGSRLRDFQKNALEHWVREYRGDLGIALTDVISTDAFLRDFDLYFCKLFDGVRHDSGDPYIWGEKIITHYNSMKIDPMTKRLIFSDNLNLDKAFLLHKNFCNRAKVSFGIGTYLSNDCGFEPLQIVMKLTRCNGQPVAKISDNPNKVMCDDINFLNYLTDVFDVTKVGC